jgi:predicted nuclease of predicted toxin-antitoxin system
VNILFDQGTPAPLRRALSNHTVITAFEKGWANLSNGNLLREAEREFDLLITTDKNLQYQQNLAGRRIAILVLPTTSWPEIQPQQKEIVAAVEKIKSGDYVTLDW